MSSMFAGAGVFNQNISSWNTSAVTTMSSMFSGANAFNWDISTWDTSAVTTMDSMFRGTESFNQDINTWNTSAVTAMTYMFYGANAFNWDISTWDTSAVTTMYSMFSDANAFNWDISNWNTSAVTTMSYMFNDANAFNWDISNWNTSAVTSMYSMFRDTQSFNQSIRSFNTSNVTNMFYMFSNAVLFDQDISCWNVVNIPTEPSTFNDLWVLSNEYKPIWWSAWYDCNNNCDNTTKPIDNWHVIYTLAPTSANQSYIKDSSTCWFSCKHFYTGDNCEIAPTLPYIELAYSWLVSWDIIELPFNGTVDIAYIDWGDETVNWCPEVVTAWTSCTYTDASAWDYTIKAYGSFTGFGKASAIGISKLTSVNKWDWLWITDLSNAFHSATNLTAIPSTLPVGTTNTSYMFDHATIFNQSLATFDTSSVTAMTDMFYYAGGFARSLECWNVEFLSDPGKNFDFKSSITSSPIWNSTWTPWACD